MQAVWCSARVAEKYIPCTPFEIEFGGDQEVEIHQNLRFSGGRQHWRYWQPEVQYRRGGKRETSQTAMAVSLQLFSAAALRFRPHGDRATYLVARASRPILELFFERFAVPIIRLPALPPSPPHPGVCLPRCANECESSYRHSV